MDTGRVSCSINVAFVWLWKCYTNDPFITTTKTLLIIFIQISKGVTQMLGCLVVLGVWGREKKEFFFVCYLKHIRKTWKGSHKKRRMRDKAKGFEKRNPCLDWRSRRLHLSPPPWLSLNFLASIHSPPSPRRWLRVSVARSRHIYWFSVACNNIAWEGRSSMLICIFTINTHNISRYWNSQLEMSLCTG